jgi:hypothetical protein
MDFSSGLAQLLPLLDDVCIAIWAKILAVTEDDQYQNER